MKRAWLSFTLAVVFGLSVALVLFSIPTLAALPQRVGPVPNTASTPALECANPCGPPDAASPALQAGAPNGQRGVVLSAPTPTATRTPQRRVRLPIIMKQRVAPGPTYTPTRTPTRTRTRTPTRTPTPTNTPTMIGPWDKNKVACPRVIRDGTLYRMWYDGYNPTAPESGWAVGLAESANGIAWTKHPANPILQPAGGTAWDSNGRLQVAVLKDGLTYKMWFSGTDGGLWQVGYATSPDGVAWTLYAGNPVLRVGPSGSWDGMEANAPAVIKDSGLFKMWYVGCDAEYTACSIGYATSTNGTTWIKYAGNPVLTGTPGQWDGALATWPSVLKNGSTYEMWYTGEHGIGRATSTDGIHWTKYAGNPVLATGWGGGSALQPTVILEGGTYKMWFRHTVGGQISIGYAESPDGIHWTVHPSNPVLTPG